MKKLLVIIALVLASPLAHSGDYIKVYNRNGWGVDFPAVRTIERSSQRYYKTQTVTRPNRYINCALNNYERALFGKKKRSCNY